MSITGKPALVYDALMTRVGTINTGSPDLPIAYPESAATFNPPSDGKYLEVADFTNAPAWQGVSSGRMDQGLLQVTVVWPKGDGLVRPKQIAAMILDHFAAGTQMSSGGYWVKVTQAPYAATAIVETDKVRIPVIIPWRA